MSRITFNQPFTPNDLQTATNAGYFGRVITQSDTYLKATYGDYTAEMYGWSFNFGARFGVVDSLVYSKNGQPFATITGMNQSISNTNTAAYLYGNDVYTGSWGNDHFYSWPGNDYYDGGSGVDTLHYNAQAGELAIAQTGNGYSVGIWGKVDTLVNVERIQLGDDGAVMALDVGQWQNTGAAYRLYKAAFDRQPDMGGLKYWINDLDKGITLQQVAKGFIDSAEFKALTPATDNKSIINSFYQHVLHRDADEGGFKYWEDAMAGGMTASEVLVSFSESAENMNNTSADLNGGLWLV
ncbi:DUF4214 domain-containing protein [Pseudomonas sp. 21LCFQ02]|uniref:DUF4214 domain-containing protein n=1 Tax=Pseudomonas sp. 21LCFQ02 TaxID=2957505 RepID=UPI00209ABA90|nr:DUF4214 domain-containing protein [Pseudomonas sp. 21LCFQ02]MCO8171019.1 DUF4214 domain-containing protein [Pseudomonas sp. 21LCFQ02]